MRLAALMWLLCGGVQLYLCTQLPIALVQISALGSFAMVIANCCMAAADDFDDELDAEDEAALRDARDRWEAEGADHG